MPSRIGREVYRARVSLDRRHLAIIVDFLNNLNLPYRNCKQVYRWRLLNGNCSHVAHNALAEAGIWTPWPTGQFFATAAFNFPVPKNEFVDLTLRTNHLPVENPHALYADEAVRRTILQFDALSAAPGSLASAQPAIGENRSMRQERLRLIFYDNPFWGDYHRHLARFFREPRYFDLPANLRHFAAAYEKAGKTMQPAKGDGEKARFLTRYERYLDRETRQIGTQLSALASPLEQPAEALT